MQLFLSENEIAKEDDDTASATDTASTSEGMNAPPEPMDMNSSLLQQLQLQDDLGAPLSEVLLYKAKPLIFNKPYARRLLVAHLKSLDEINKKAQLKNAKAAYVGVATALGTDYDDAARQLLPQWEQMLRYRNTMLKVKEKQLEQDIELGKALDESRINLMQNELNAIKAHSVKSEWKIEARRMLEAERGRLPGQLFSPQPYFLPLRISAPPRVGKSAAALLMASLAKRAGMKTIYSVSPNKNTPIQEMQTKLIRIGWRDEDEARAMDKLKSEGNLAGVTENLDCVQMKYSHFVIDNVPGQSKAAPDYDKIDMILYSSDVPADCQRIGAVLANWRYRDVIVFHIRDEAQSLAKALENSVVKAHKRDVPPPVELQYLRYYYGNSYGLNCNVTATHFPTLLEEKMWGYIGSVRQNAAAGLPLSADVRKIGTQLGANFLPTLVPALLPVVPAGYIGVNAMRTWAPGGKPRTLKMGANHSGVDFNTGELRRAVEKLPPNTTNKRQAAAAAPRLTRAQRAEKKRRALDHELDAAEQNEAREEAIRDANKPVDEVFRNLAPNYVAGLDGEEQKKTSKRKASDDADFVPDDYDPEVQPTKPKNTKLTQAQQKAKDAEEKADRERNIKADISSVSDHFEEWMKTEEKNIDEWRNIEDGSEEAAPGPQGNVNLVPMYIGALNNDISDTGMVSFIRMFGEIAHKNAQEALPRRLDGISDKTIAQRREKYGVAFVLFTTALTNRQDVVDSAIKLHDTPDPVKDAGLSDAEQEAILQKLKLPNRTSSPLATQKSTPSACEPVAESKKMSALCCIYDPHNPKNFTLSKDKEPFFEAFFVSAADVAIESAWDTLGINKVAVLGYGMLQAGLTLQTVVERTDAPKRIYCPKYVALATAENAALDAQLQIAGRSFVEIKGLPAPTGWKIEFLGVEGRVEALQRYSEMEEALARIAGKRVYEALKDGFGYKMMVANSLKTLGVVGTQRGDFSSILGLTPTDALKRAKVAKKLRESPGGTLTVEQQKDALEQALALEQQAESERIALLATAAN